MWFFSKKPKEGIYVFNTKGREKQLFEPVKTGEVRMYTCGPTVYDVAHIGNLRAALFPDIVRRVFEYAGYKVKSVINVTDFGHLAADDETSEDKMTIALRREDLPLTLENMKIVAEKFTQIFLSDMAALNAKPALAYPRASDHVAGMIAYIQMLLDKGYAYKTSDGIYFDTVKFPEYGCLGGSVSAEHSRIGVSEEKHDPRDFSLWKNDDRGWDSPWQKGFPGWHIECVAMATRYLGKSFDIHAGGVDLIPIHHNNEIAEAEAANGKSYARYWLHNEFLTIDGHKVSKSLGNTVSLQQIRDRGIHPVALRYWFLTGHYRSLMNFTWEAVQGAHTALNRAQKMFADLKGTGVVSEAYKKKFDEVIFDDFNTPEAIATLWELLKDSSVEESVKRATVLTFDKVLGLGFGNTRSRMKSSKVSVEEELPEDIQELVKERETARAEKNYARADEIRAAAGAAGYTIEDGPEGPIVKKTTGIDAQ